MSEAAISLVDRLPNTDLYSVLRTQQKHSISMRFFDELKGKSLEEILAHQHIELGDSPTLDKLLISNHIPPGKQLLAYSISSGYPYLYDLSDINVCRQVASNPVLKDTLNKIHASIAIVENEPCIIAGSPSALQYLNENDTNQYCPINNYFKVHNRKKHLFSGQPEHIEKLKLQINQVKLEATYNLTGSAELQRAFESAIDSSCYQFQIVVTKDTGKLVRVNAAHPEITTKLTEVLSSSNSLYILGMMAATADHAQQSGDAYVYVESEFEGTKKFAYSCSTINTTIASLHEFTLRPVLGDTYQKDVSSANDNISAHLRLIDDACNRNKPIVLQLAKNNNMARAMYAAITHMIHQDDIPLALINSCQFAYSGDKLIATKMSSLDCLSGCLPSTPTFFGEITSKTDVAVIEQCISNMVQIIAFTKIPLEQLPHSLRPYVTTPQ
ncbi:hypothetical protein [Vibrio coralliilyticus]|uniref:hypothetical protein n=1 Tax=Vibrio coralliilyticus TaxID=190893 RepID=UPI001E38910D|nr:hypothetical protein [Vibrio coralliilyticus]MCC2524930.1 hypothetical protein [Vibrio coralliilyticus]